MNPLFSGGAIVAAALFSGSLFFWVKPLEAETLSPQSQQQKKQELAQTTNQEPLIGSTSLIASPSSGLNTSSSETLSGAAKGIAAESTSSVLPPVSYSATAYSLRGRTASGKHVNRGLIAADPRLLPLGSRIRLEAGTYSGDYLVADTGGLIRGRKIDIWTPSSREAMRFGRRKVKLTVLSYGAKRSVPKRRARS